MLKAIHLTSAIISMNSIVWDAALIIISKTTTEVTKIIPRENSLHGLIKTSLYVFFLLFSHVKSFWLAVICLLKFFMPKFTCLFEKRTCEKKNLNSKLKYDEITLGHFCPKSVPQTRLFVQHCYGTATYIMLCGLSNQYFSIVIFSSTIFVRSMRLIACGSIIL